jgi:predicted PurR-regulated permease PerM
VLLAVWAGASVGGILGVLVAVPVVAVAAVAVRQWRDYRAIEGLVRDHAGARVAAGTEPDGPTASPRANP